MKIREIELKNFGKFTSKKITVQDGIQLFYGENESGKSTVHTFIKSMLLDWSGGEEELRQMTLSANTSHGRMGIIIQVLWLLNVGGNYSGWRGILISILRRQC